MTVENTSMQNKFITLLFTIVMVSGCSENDSDITVYIEGNDKLISVDGHTIVYGEEGNGPVNYHDRSEVDATFTIWGLNNGISYALLADDGSIIGHAFDIEQDGNLDLKQWYDKKKTEVRFNDNWYTINEDAQGQFIIVESGKVYIKKDKQSLRYYIP